MEIRDLCEEVLNYLGDLEFKHGDSPKNIEEELNKFGWSIKDKESIGMYNSLLGYLNEEIEEWK